jgi:hypothetical protein
MVTESSSPIHHGSDAWPRWVSHVIGAWVFISAFVWPHTLGEQTDTWILGSLIFLVSIWAMYEPRVRFVNTALSTWLFFATLIIGHSEPATVWSNCIAAIAVFIMSLTPTIQTSLTSGGRRSLPAT